MSTFAQRLQSLIDRKIISQRDVAERVGIDESRVSNWLSGKVKSPRRITIIKLAQLFDCEVDWLATGVGVPFPTNDNPADGMVRISSGLRPRTTSNPPGFEKVAATISPGPSRKKTMSKAAETHPKNMPTSGQDNESLNIDDALAMTRYILESDTVYRGALLSNIRAFHQGVKREEEMAGVDERMADMQKTMDLMMKMLQSLGAILPNEKRETAAGNGE